MRMRLFRKRLFFCTLGVILLATAVEASQIYVRLSDPVYPFLDRMATTGLIRDLQNNTLPLQRDEVAGYLQEIYNQREELREVDRDILREFMADYRLELTGEKYFRLRESGGDTWFLFGSGKNFKQGTHDIFSYPA